MASGVINGFFRRNRAGQPLRALANVENLNKIANILNDITGQGCYIDKPLNGDDWVVRISDNESGEVPTLQQKVLSNEVQAANRATYSESNNSISASSVAITVNGISVSIASALQYWWPNSAGMKYLYVLATWGYAVDAEGQKTGTTRYVYATDTTGMGADYAIIAKIPYCRVDIPVVGEPPHIQCLLEGPLALYCYRADNQARAFVYNMDAAQLAFLKPRSITTESTDNLPIKVRNISASADGYYNEYPNGRFHIVTSNGVDDVEWYQPKEPEHAKNNAKLLLLRYLYPQGEVPHGLPYWRTISQFLDNSETWLTDYISESIEDDKSWLISILTPWAWEVWNTHTGEYQPRLEADAIEGVEIVAALMDKSGHWHSIFDIVASQADLDVALTDFDDIKERFETVEAQAQSCVDAADDAEDTADAAQQTIAGFTDYTQNVSLVSYEAGNQSGHVGMLMQDFSALNDRITALEQRLAQ